MAIQNVQATKNSNQDTAAKALAAKTVTQDDFLRLLITQLQNQDPLAPMDSQEFAAKLATFNSLSQLIEINDNLGAMQNGQGSMSQYNAASLIGKEISAAGNQIGLSSGATANIGYQLGANAAKVVVTIFSPDSELVRRIDAGTRSAGAQSLLWDGKDGNGKAVRPGVYGFEITAVDINGKKIASAGKLQCVASGVKLDGAESVV